MPDETTSIPVPVETPVPQVPETPIAVVAESVAPVQEAPIEPIAEPFLESLTAQMAGNEPLTPATPETQLEPSAGQTATAMTEPVPVQTTAPEVLTIEPIPSETVASVVVPVVATTVVQTIKNTVHELLNKAQLTIQNKKRKKIDRVMTLFVKQTKITNNEVEKLLHISDATATRYLATLEKEGKIKQNGKIGKWVSYSKI